MKKTDLINFHTKINSYQNDEESRQYLSTVLDNISNWRFNEYDDPKIIYPQYPENNNLGISFLYDSIGNSDEEGAIIIYSDNENNPYSDFKEVHLTFDNFKILLLAIMSTQNHDSLSLTIGDLWVEYSNERLLVDLMFDPIVIKKESFKSILYVWEQILGFDLHFHMNNPPVGYVDDEEEDDQ